MLNVVVAIIAIMMLALVLGAVVRFSVVSSWRTRNAEDRLSHPDVDGVERACGFPPPADLVRMYRERSLTTLAEFSLVDTARNPHQTWSFGGFYPLTYKDVSEQRKIHGITTGIPIADDMAKGVYYVTSTGTIRFRPPGRNATEREVAPSAEALSRFQIVDEEAEV